MSGSGACCRRGGFSPSKSRRIASCDFSIEQRLQEAVCGTDPFREGRSLGRTGPLPGRRWGVDCSGDADSPRKSCYTFCRLRCASDAAPRDSRETLPTGRVVMAQIEIANPNTRDLNTFVFSSEDLSFFQLIVEELLAGLIASGDYVAHGDGREALKRDLARAIFASARPGERDAASLKQLVMRSRMPAAESRQSFEEASMQKPRKSPNNRERAAKGRRGRTCP